MPICEKCGHDNPRGTLVCSNCFSFLTDSVPVQTVALKKRDSNSSKRVNTGGTERTEHRNRLSQHSIALYIDGATDPTIVLLVSQTILGRVVPGENRQSLFDLSGYRAQERGVSRQHAVLKRTDKGIFVEDMGSSNGSWLNNEVLKPYTPALIQSGDRLRLSQIEIEIYLPESE